MKPRPSCAVAVAAASFSGSLVRLAAAAPAAEATTISVPASATTLPAVFTAAATVMATPAPIQERETTSSKASRSSANAGEDEEYIEAEGLCPHGIGAVLAIPNVRQHLLGQHPAVYDWAMPVSAMSSVMMLFVAVPHLHELKQAEYSSEFQERQKLTIVASAVPAVVSAFKFLAIFGPRLWKILFLFAACYEVLAFWCFKQLILNLAGGSDEWSEKEVLAILATQEPLPKMWASPPLACCFKPCARRRAVLERDLGLISALMWQFIIILPMVSLLDMFEAMEKFHEHLAQLETASLVLAMYSLFSLLDATHVTLHHHRTHAKFWTIKGTFIGSTMVLRIVSTIVTKDVKIGNECYSAGALAAAYSGAITAVLAVPLAALSRYAFPAGEEGQLQTSSEEESTEMMSKSGDEGF